jgi:hypothetical protein
MVSDTKLFTLLGYEQRELLENNGNNVLGDNLLALDTISEGLRVVETERITQKLRVGLDNQANLVLDTSSEDLVSMDDNYEENDTLATAYDLSSHEGTPLSSLNGLGIQADDDWYQIEVMPGEERVMVDLTFTHADGNLGLVLYDASGVWIAQSNGFYNEEHINTAVSGAGVYYLKVYGDNAGNTYDLWWDDLPIDDNYEENDRPPGFFLPQSLSSAVLMGQVNNLTLIFTKLRFPRVHSALSPCFGMTST